MSDLGGDGGSLGAPRGRNDTDYGANTRAQGPPVPTGSPNIRGPRDIMRERAAREARRKAAQEAVETERARAEEQQVRQMEDARRDTENRAAGVAPGRGSGGDPGYGPDQSGARISDNSQRSDRQRRSGGSGQQQDAAISGRGTGGTALGGGDPVPPGRTRSSSAGQPQPRPIRTGPPNTGANQPGLSGPTTQNPESSNGGKRGTPSSFPHAFERWETLSAHWEGLTSYWVRRLEENSNEINANPLSQQLSRQVTDLSAAGANLFHAVVELQRLRASSERKFQRWFYETRTEQERAQEIQALLENNLQEERTKRAKEVEAAKKEVHENSNSERLLAEMRRELQISKEEARRAWEELGRREQEERERTISLREGLPTTVGGVQVVPMMQGMPNRPGGSRDNRPQTRDGPSGGNGSTAEVIEDPEQAYHRNARTQHNDSDPFTDTRGAANAAPARPPQASTASVQPPASGPFYQQHQGTSLHPISDVGSAGTYSEGEYEIDAQGQFRRDSQGRRIHYGPEESDDSADEYDTSAERAREGGNVQQYGHPSNYPSGSTGAGRGQPYQPNQAGVSNAAYAGEDYIAPGWEDVPRHHHPTRLSDVLEEDERSRTSASQISRRD